MHNQKCIIHSSSSVPEASLMVAKQDIWAMAIWVLAPETLAVINPASILSKHYFDQSKFSD